jgi:prevent-host-death family protein
MTTLTASEARANLYRLIDQAAESHQPIHIAGKRTSAVLLAAEDWQAIQETLFLHQPRPLAVFQLRLRRDLRRLPGRLFRQVHFPLRAIPFLFTCKELCTLSATLVHSAGPTQ